MRHKNASVNTVVCENLSARPDLAGLLAALVGQPYATLGDFAPGSPSRFHYLGLINSALTIRVEADKRDPFAALRKLSEPPAKPSEVSTDFPFIGGWVGFLSYDLNRFIERLPDQVGHDIPLPLSEFYFCDTIVAWDEQVGRGALLALDYEQQQQDARRRLDRLKQVIETTSSTADFSEKSGGSDGENWLAGFEANLSEAAYLERIRRAKDYIRAGDIYEVNLSRRLACEFQGRAEDLYFHLTRSHPAGYAALIQTTDFSIVSLSPELFLQKRGRDILTRPIKGTIARGSDPQSDQANYQTLLNSEKDRAELNMIIDLERNDLGRVCEYGSIRVLTERVIETHPTLYHAVATVAGRLRADAGLIDIIRATFPGGSVTGAPKIRSMEIIDELEPTARSIYCGGIGWVGLNGDFDLNIAIRTIILHAGRAYLQTGGAIVDDSDPEREYQETLTKASALARAILECKMKMMEQNAKVAGSRKQKTAN